jgi:exoribonuclease II
MSSPLRRYIDLINQWQLAAALSGRKPPFTRTSDALLGALRAFEVTYARYDEHQRAMEGYWSLRWLVQEQAKTLDAVVLRENLVRVEGLPLAVRVSSLPALDAGTRVRLEIGAVDLIERTLVANYRETLGGGAAVQDVTEEAGQKA